MEKKAVYDICIGRSVGGPGPSITGGSFYSKEKAEAYAEELKHILSGLHYDMAVYVRLRDAECNDIAEGPSSLDRILEYCAWFAMARRC